MIEEMKEANVITLNKGDIVKGRITKLEDGQALVDVGYKYDGVIRLASYPPCVWKMWQMPFPWAMNWN